jgi:DNA processing protein
MNSTEAYIALNMVDHVGPILLKRLLDAFGEPQKILRASRKELIGVTGVGEVVAESISTWEANVDLQGELRRVADANVRVLTWADTDYPENLRKIADPPIVLYVKGRLDPRDKNAIAIVGSRMTTLYGQETARQLGYQLAYAGFTVISGGARGIDTSAHQGALAAKGRTIAVLGTGIDIVFPPENDALFAKIVESGGALMTQFPFGRQGDVQTFPIRNRIVSGLSLGVVVVEAGLASGALITAGMAADHGRQVYAVPGRIDSPHSRGCHKLIKSGAKLVENAEDVLSEFEYLFPQSQRPKSAAASPSAEAVALSETEQKVFDAISNEETEIDAVIRQSGLTTAQVSASLLALEMKRLVKQRPGKRFVRVRNTA